MSQIQSRRRRKRNVDNASSSQQPPPPTNKIISRGGIEGKRGRRILDGYFFDPTELEGTLFWSLINFQGWEMFITSHEVIYEELVYFFYEQVAISLEHGLVTLSIMFRDVLYEYTSRDFMEDFGLESEGFLCYVDGDWPSGLSSYLEISLSLTHERRFPPGDNRDPNLPWMQLFDGDDYFIANSMMKAIVPSGTQDRRLSRVVAALFHVFKGRQKINLPFIIGAHMHHSMFNTHSSILPYGMLITHIMKKWGIRIPQGPPKPKSVHKVGAQTLRNQGLIMFRGILWSKVQIGEASPEDRMEIEAVARRGRRDRGRRSNVDVEEDIERADADVGGVAVHGESSGHMDIREEISRLSERQERMERRQKKQGKFLRGLAKFMGCIGRKLGVSEEDQRHLHYSDSDAEPVTHAGPSDSPVHTSDFCDDDDGMGSFGGTH